MGRRWITRVRAISHMLNTHHIAVPIVAAETHGSNCFYHSVSLNPGRWNSSQDLPAGITAAHNAAHNVKVARLEKQTSLATSLGATSPSPGVVKMALEREGGVKCVSQPDEMAMQAARLFAGQCFPASIRRRKRLMEMDLDEHRMLVELACSATLAMGKPELFSQLVPGQPKTVVFIVCGGFKISLEDMRVYGELLRVDTHISTSWEVLCDGTVLRIHKEDSIMTGSSDAK